MRLFAAIPVPQPALGEVGRLLAELRGHEWPVRWVRSEGLHLTLKFFGEVADDRVEPIVEALRFASEGTASLALSVLSLGAFPNHRRPRVIWIGLEGPPALELLQDRIERNCERLGFALESNPFHPHITLGRVREGSRLPPQATGRLGGEPLNVPFVADTVILYESRLRRDGSRYSPRATIPLTN